MSPLHHLNPQATTPQHLPAQPFAPSGAQHPDPYCQQGRPWPAEPGVTAPTIQKQDITLREATRMRLHGFLPPSRRQCEQGHPRTGGVSTGLLQLLVVTLPGGKRTSSSL